MTEVTTTELVDTGGDAAPAASGGGATGATLRPAGASRRLAAGLVDTILLAGGLGLVFAVGWSAGGWEGWATAAWALVFAPLYFGLYHGGGKGATPGQLELRIALSDDWSPGPPELARAIARAYVGVLFLALVVPALVELILLFRSGRTLRDRVSGTIVVHLCLPGPVSELERPTVPELVELFEPPPGTRRYLRRGWELWRARPRAILGSVAAVYALLLAVALVLGLLVAADAETDVWVLIPVSALLVFFLASSFYWAQAAVLLAIERTRTTADRVAIGGVLRGATRRLNALSAALALLLVLAWLPAVMWILVVPLLLFGRLVLVVPALVLEDRRVLGSFRRSWELTEGATWRILGLLLLSLAILGALTYAQLAAVVYAGIALEASSVVVVVAIVAITAAAAAPFVVALAWLGAAWALVYEDARRRLPPRLES